MPDRRKLILDRLEDLLGSIDGLPASVVIRNRPAMDTEDRPCMVLLDGGETVHQNFEGRAGRVYARNSSSVMMLEPEIYALLEAREASRAGEFADLFTQYRNAIIYAILNDADLANLTGANGDIAYRGHQTDMRSGSAMQGEMRLDFRFYYVLDPAEDLA